MKNSQKMHLKKVKNALIISFLSIVIGTVQMVWFLPNGLSCIDAKSSVLDSILNFMPIQFLVVFLFEFILKPKLRIYIISIFLCLFWFFVNKHEFTYRHACWSTYSKESIFNTSLFFSLIPISICLAAFIIGYTLDARKKDL